MSLASTRASWLTTTTPNLLATSPAAAEDAAAAAAARNVIALGERQRERAVTFHDARQRMFGADVGALDAQVAQKRAAAAALVEAERRDAAAIAASVAASNNAERDLQARRRAELASNVAAQAQLSAERRAASALVEVGAWLSASACVEGAGGSQQLAHRQANRHATPTSVIAGPVSLPLGPASARVFDGEDPFAAKRRAAQVRRVGY